ncbi:MAG TPA: glycosyltransferase, partial [Candidatus Fraserbacteria bacterium]|nr:glycosyltransferase [Candidatus Fraserbacteria bacterium]
NPAWPRPAWRRRLDRHMEARLLKRLDRLILTTEGAKASYLEHYAGLAPEQIAVLPSGYDPAEYAQIPAEGSSRFRLVYTGRFYAGTREPQALWAALAQLGDLDYELLVAGERAGPERLPPQVRFLGFVSRRRALALQKGASILLFLGNRSPEPQAQLPAKLFEYLAAGRPILAIRSDADDFAAKLVQQWRRGPVVENRPEAIAGAIRKAQALWRRGQLERSFDLSPHPEYSWEQLGGRLAVILRQVIAGA